MHSEGSVTEQDRLRKMLEFRQKQQAVRVTGFRSWKLASSQTPEGLSNPRGLGSERIQNLGAFVMLQVRFQPALESLWLQGFLES